MTKAQKAESVREIYEAKRVFTHAIKAERGCRDCGEKDPIVLDFHHIEEKHPALRKKKGARRAFICLGWDALHIEIKKCIVLCANCHRRLHAKKGC